MRRLILLVPVAVLPHHGVTGETVHPVAGPVFTMGQRDTSRCSPILSPRLLALKMQLDAGNRAALDSFWRATTISGAPLVERIPGQHRYLHVTFVWRGSAETRNVLLVSEALNRLANAEHVSGATLARLDTTDLWYRTFRLRNDARFTYQFSEDDHLVPAPSLTPQQARMRSVNSQPDRLNGKALGRRSVLELPEAAPQPWTEHQPGVSPGTVSVRTFSSHLLGGERRVWVYTPSGYRSDGAAHNLLVFLDGYVHVGNVSTPVLPDNLIALGKIPPSVAVMVDIVDQETRTREFLPHEPFADFLAEELVPWMRVQYRVASSPSRTLLGGISLGGPAVAFAGLRHSNVFGNIGAQSGAFPLRRTIDDWNTPTYRGQVFEENLPESEWIARQYATGPKLPLRFFLAVGLFEDHPRFVPEPRFATPSTLVANRHLRDVLQAKCYEVQYREVNEAHEELSWRGTLADGLVTLLGTGLR